MERVKVHTFHSNCNDVICKYMNAERVNEHILYVAEEKVYDTNSKTYYYIGTAKDSLGFQIPAKLGKIMTLNKNDQ